MYQSTSDFKNKSPAFKSALPQILAVCIKNVLLLGYGMTLGFPTILIPSLSANDSSEKLWLDQEEISWMGSLNLICVPLGCLLSGPVTQPVGRKRSMQMSNIPFLAAWLLYKFSDEKWQIYLALCITGFTGGIIEAPVLTYVAEITQPHLRGILSSTSTLTIMLGVLSQFVLGSFFSWKAVALINCAIPIVSFILLQFAPESPLWLITRNRLIECRKSLAWLKGWVEVKEIERDFQELLLQNKQTRANSQSEMIKDNETKQEALPLSKFQTIKLLGKKNCLWPYAIITLTFILGHFNGNTSLQVYSIKIFAALKTPINKYYATISLGVAQLLGCIICVVCINILGKRVINFISLLGSAVCFLVAAIYAYITDVKSLEANFNIQNSTIYLNTDTSTTSNISDKYYWVPMVFLILSAFLSFVGIKILPWILTGEVFDAEVRATASGLSTGTGYIIGFVSNKMFLSLVSYLTLPGLFLFYSSVSVIGTILLYFLLPETEGKTVFEITEHFAGRNKLGTLVRGNKEKDGQCNYAFEPENKNLYLESRL